ncbi:hypothetical protein SAMN05444722_0653 [Rhodovulum sp. ES.010]|uniref:hypothetical protein n=1 Tax=Rhodovulum sp. ES.010 TaxID=1882821 RepID=UPI00092A3DB5|nr:hypothetical protein [Rhodovulum sp. ES.010]SIO16006.1 hypothetical protein SAMN05444722_0653 [Rhodovulum sp. ES.010]
MNKGTPFDGALLGLTLCLVVGTVPLCLGLAGPPAPGRPALVIAPPWGDRLAAAVAAGGGHEIGPFVAPLARFAVLERPGKTRAAGAWAVLDADALMTLCGFEGERL